MNLDRNTGDIECGREIANHECVLRASLPEYSREPATVNATASLTDKSCKCATMNVTSLNVNGRKCAAMNANTLQNNQ